MRILSVIGQQRADLSSKSMILKPKFCNNSKNCGFSARLKLEIDFDDRSTLHKPYHR